MARPSVRVMRSLNVRPGEGSLVGSVAAVFAVLEIARGFGEVGVDTMILGRFGPAGLPGLLPFLFMALGSVGLVVAIAYGAALGRVRRDRLFVGILVGAGLLIVALRIGLVVSDAAVTAILWLTVFATGMLAMTLYWTLAGAAFDARQAKRLFPLLTGAAIVGSFVGTLGAGPMAALLGVENLVLLEAALLAGAAFLVRRIPIRRPLPLVRPSGQASIVRQVRVGFDFVRSSPLMSLVATAYVLLSILMFSVSYPFLLAASAEFDDDVVVATVLGALSAGVTATSLLVSVVIAPRLYARFGVTAGALLLPLVYVAGFGLWLVHFSFATAAFVRFTQQVTQRGISNAAWSSLYNTVPADRRGQVLAFIDGVPGQIGTILSGILLLVAGRILAPDQVLWLGVGTALVATGVVVGIRRRYAGSLLAALRSGAAEQVLEGGPGVGALLRDPSVERALLDAVVAPEPGVREMATSLLGRIATPATSAALLTATGDPDGRVRAGALLSLASTGADVSALDLERLAGDPSSTVRAAAIVARARAGGRTPIDLASDPAPEIRAAAIATLPDDTALDAILRAALDDETAIVRVAAAARMAATGMTAAMVDDVLSTGTPGAQRAVLDAIARLPERDPEVDEIVARWARHRLDRAADLQRARLAIERDPGESAAAQAFLVSVLSTRQRDLEDMALGALAVLGVPEARGVIRRCLRSNDVEIRAQAMEALDSIGDRALAGSLVRLLEGGDGREPGLRRDALQTLASDDDAWIRALAERCDVDGGHEMATQRTLTDLDTMLLLRRVPLFVGLSPEDLQRVAAASEERAWTDGQALMREGDLGDEMVVLMSGSVRVTRAEPDGGEREVRRYIAGEHIGELAVLRERPRAATVSAVGPVRGLVIGGAALTSILRERPDAAMALLATLAERISAQ